MPGSQGSSAPVGVIALAGVVASSSNVTNAPVVAPLAGGCHSARSMPACDSTSCSCENAECSNATSTSTSVTAWQPVTVATSWPVPPSGTTATPGAMNGASSAEVSGHVAKSAQLSTMPDPPASSSSTVSVHVPPSGWPFSFARGCTGRSTPVAGVPAAAAASSVKSTDPPEVPLPAWSDSNSSAPLGCTSRNRSWPLSGCSQFTTTLRSVSAWQLWSSISNDAADRRSSWIANPVPSKAIGRAPAGAGGPATASAASNASTARPLITTARLTQCSLGPREAPR